MRERTGNGEHRIVASIIEQRREKEDLARRLAEEATTQWQNLIQGVVALPAAIALTAAASTLYIATFIASGLEVFERLTRSMEEHGRRELERSGSSEAEREKEHDKEHDKERESARA